MRGCRYPAMILHDGSTSYPPAVSEESLDKSWRKGSDRLGDLRFFSEGNDFLLILIKYHDTCCLPSGNRASGYGVRVVF